MTLRRDPDWWAKDLPSNRGLYNFDEVRYDYYRDASSMFEAFKSGLYDVRPEGDAGRWATQYVFPALRDGRVLKETIPNGLPKGMNALRLQHPTPNLPRSRGARGAHPALRLRMGEQEPLLRRSMRGPAASSRDRNCRRADGRWTSASAGSSRPIPTLSRTR